VQSAISVRPIVGGLVATGDERDLLKNAVVVGGQASYNLNSNFAVLGSFAWSPSEEEPISPRPKVVWRPARSASTPLRPAGGSASAWKRATT
jgi:hypothetical protein